MSVRSSPSRRAACCARAALGWTARAWFRKECVRQIVSETVVRALRLAAWDTGWWSSAGGKLVSPQHADAWLIKRYPPPRCTKRAPRRAPRQRRQPSSDWPRWTRRAARRGRPPCARPWRWAPGGWALIRTQSLSGMPLYIFPRHTVRQTCHQSATERARRMSRPSHGSAVHAAGC